MGRLHQSTALAAVLALAAGVGAAYAGTNVSSTSTSSGGCGCVSTTHQVKVPGVQITAPVVSVNLPTLNVTTGGSNSSSNSSSDSSSSSSSSSNNSSSNNSSTSITSSNVSTAQAVANSNSLNNGSGGGGGSGSWSDTGSVTTTIDTVQVETPQPQQPLQTRRICAEFKAATKMIAIQASCLDDKSIPHPASQLGPEREIIDSYEGELYRCIAGARMQYTIADYSGQANFDHGQTLTCQKGEALYHTNSGALQCRPQKPARDCNERSLLRRFGAGIKVVKISQTNMCVAWRTETVQGDSGE